ncbi:hypothetical protein T4B_9417 [Trichinella pseudospiralis]|uniref:Uncharacterized protein n=1 Tax=Trichinella pseudospiralis TaxID=6337 RepID=A0A0V1JI35_TRIPS|nr:hypothetical protein T4B_9417 [Trichinella pseudospiralis]
MQTEIVAKDDQVILQKQNYFYNITQQSGMNNQSLLTAAVHKIEKKKSYICILTTPLIMTCELSCWLAVGSNSRILVKSWKRDFAWQLDVYGV